MIHQWIYVIIPIVIAEDVSPAYFVAYCKGCNTYFSEPVPLGKAWRMSKAHLPREGCTESRAPNLGE